MSNSLAIAAVTSTLRYVLERALEADHPGSVGGATVTTLPPGELAGTTITAAPGINLHLYDVRPSHAWNLTDLPTRGSDGGLVRRPMAALDLYYLLTCYGDAESLDAQRLLGRAVIALAVTPILTRDVINEAIELYSVNVPTDFLAESDLADQMERVKIAPYALSLEEMSKLWATFSTPHQLSQTYVATAALVEADVAPRRPLPVRQRTVSVVAGGPVVLTEVIAGPRGAAVTGDRIVLRGAGLRGRPKQITRIRVGPAILTPEAGGTAAELEVTLDGTVPAGLHGVQVSHITSAAGAVPARVNATSNALPLLVRPGVALAEDAGELKVTPPLVGGQSATILLSRLTSAPSGEPDVVSIRFAPLAPDAAPLDRLTITDDEVPAGEWLIRVRVDGVDSVPELVGEVYGGPALTVP
ncbi:DUF4255 domain-containing protein [Nonomuraea sp. B5E05]|uniref:DUF4255 domain-containing protein n=1 Tax=Nonomuraea sp. B5E05 TaxID=3153569 RepID=UPI003261C58C